MIQQRQARTGDAARNSRVSRERAWTHTPLARLRIHVGAGSHLLGLKLEDHNPTGSIKFRTALGLLAGLDDESPLVPGTRVVESTSGNLGIALSLLLEELGCQFVAVIDPKVPKDVRDAIARHGAEVIEVDTRDAHGGYLLTRLAAVRQLLDRDPLLRWTDQYSNPANPGIVRDAMAPELVAQTDGAIDAVLVAVSTGGTLVGLSNGFRSLRQGTAVYAVDVAGSLVTANQAYPHLLTGIGATRKSSFMRRHHHAGVVRVSDTLAFALCRLLRADTGLAVGGSGGAVIAAFVEGVRANGMLSACRYPVAVIADGGATYRSTLYDDVWLLRHGALEVVESQGAAMRRGGIGFELVQVADG